MLNATWLLAQDDGGSAVAALIPAVIGLLIGLVVLAGVWKTFEKAGKPGWAAIIPIYNIIVILEIAGKPLWWIILFLIPCVNIIVSLLVFIALAKSFGKSEVFGIGLWLFGFICFPILGFGDAKYIGPPRS